VREKGVFEESCHGAGSSFTVLSHRSTDCLKRAVRRAGVTWFTDMNGVRHYARLGTYKE